MNHEIYEFFQNYHFNYDLIYIKYDISGEMYHKYFIETPFNVSICRALRNENVDDVIQILNLFQNSSCDEELLFEFMDYCREMNINSDVALSAKYLITLLEKKNF